MEKKRWWRIVHFSLPSSRIAPDIGHSLFYNYSAQEKKIYVCSLQLSASRKSASLVVAIDRLQAVMADSLTDTPLLNDCWFGDGKRKARAMSLVQRKTRFPNWCLEGERVDGRWNVVVLKKIFGCWTSRDLRRFARLQSTSLSPHFPTWLLKNS